MSLRARCGVVLVAAALVGLGALVARSQEAEPGIPALVNAAQTRFELVDATFLTQLSGDNADYSEKKPDQYHAVVVTVKVTKPAGRELTLHPADFTLHYRRSSGGHDVAPCNGISVFSASKDVDRKMSFFSAGFGSVSTGVTTQKSDVIYTDLFFQNMEPDTRDLYLLVAQPVGAHLVVSGWSSAGGGGTTSSGLEGVWEDTSTKTKMTIARQGSGYTVTSAVDDSGEAYPVSNVQWANGVLKWTYSVPSTGYKVNWTMVELRGDKLETRWDGTAGSGTEVLERVATASGPGGGGLEGSWEDTSTKTTMTIVRQGDGYSVSSAVDNDGEVFPVSNVVWANGVLQWTYTVPSTGYKVNWTTVQLRGDELETKWNGTAGNGTEVLHRTGAGTAPRGDTSLSGLGVRIVHVARRLADAQEAAKRLRNLGAQVELFETSEQGNEPHVGHIYALNGHAAQADTIAGLVRDLEVVTRADRSPDSFNAGQQFNLWIVR